MRRDLHLRNFSGGLSLVSGCAIDDVIDDGRADDAGFAARDQVVLLGLVGDDAPVVRLVVDEPLTADEDVAWLARVRRRLDVPDGRVLLVGGFDPDDLAGWRDGEEPMGGVEVVAVPPGRWDVDLYTHVGSMNGRELLERPAASGRGRRAKARPLGTWFRASHPGAPLPAWLAHHLELDGTLDPEHEDAWGDVAAAVGDGRLAIDLAHRSFVGFLIHLTPAIEDRALDEVGDDGWIDPAAGARPLATCPRGLPSTADDPELAASVRRWAGEAEPDAPADDDVDDE